MTTLGNSDIVLQATGLCRSFASEDARIDVLRDADLSVHSGEVVGIVGASGVGKSTLLHILGSLDRPDSGRVEIGGRDIHAISGRELDRLRTRVIGFVFQFHFLLPDFTARENVMMPLLIAGETERRASERAGYWLGKVGLSDRLTHRPGELSGGEQQRVAVARSLANEPEVIFADEPTGNLDDATGESVHELIRSLADSEGKTFVVVTHKRNFAKYADRVLELVDGRVIPG